MLKDRPKDALSSISQAVELKPNDARLVHRKNVIQQTANTYDGPANSVSIKKEILCNF